LCFDGVDHGAERRLTGNVDGDLVSYAREGSKMMREFDAYHDDVRTAGTKTRKHEKPT
jgi:hypothetical protein